MLEKELVKFIFQINLLFNNFMTMAVVKDSILVLWKDVNNERLIVSITKEMLEEIEDFLLWKKMKEVENEEVITVDAFLEELWENDESSC